MLTSQQRCKTIFDQFVEWQPRKRIENWSKTGRNFSIQSWEIQSWEFFQFNPEKFFNPILKNFPIQSWECFQSNPENFFNPILRIFFNSILRNFSIQSWIFFQSNCGRFFNPILRIFQSNPEPNWWWQCCLSQIARPPARVGARLGKPCKCKTQRPKVPEVHNRKIPYRLLCVCVFLFSSLCISFFPTLYFSFSRLTLVGGDWKVSSFVRQCLPPT